eukprot:scaffold158786_cov35-Tisochrysis_lutea.AAC.1
MQYAPRMWAPTISLASTGPTLRRKTSRAVSSPVVMRSAQPRSPRAVSAPERRMAEAASRASRGASSSASVAPADQIPRCAASRAAVSRSVSLAAGSTSRVVGSVLGGARLKANSSGARTSQMTTPPSEMSRDHTDSLRRWLCPPPPPARLLRNPLR